MPVGSSVDKSLAELRNWGQTDPYGLADYSFALQAEVRRLRDAAAQNSTNSSRPPSSDRSESPKPKSLRKASGRKPGGQPGHPGRTLQWAPDPNTPMSTRSWSAPAEKISPANPPSILKLGRYLTCLP